MVGGVGKPFPLPKGPEVGVSQLGRPATVEENIGRLEAAMVLDRGLVDVDHTLENRSRCRPTYVVCEDK